MTPESGAHGAHPTLLDKGSRREKTSARLLPGGPRPQQGAAAAYGSSCGSCRSLCDSPPCSLWLASPSGWSSTPPSLDTAHQRWPDARVQLLDGRLLAFSKLSRNAAFLCVPIRSRASANTRCKRWFSRCNSRIWLSFVEASATMLRKCLSSLFSSRISALALAAASPAASFVRRSCSRNCATSVSPPSSVLLSSMAKLAAALKRRIFSRKS
mmetsp:Transcript_10422/g.28286  ORF Transcript_10422/g.28286 Transcript_10422/m.28286 type:complete len:212 (+) Transcript_10422:236-871(+)